MARFPVCFLSCSLQDPDFPVAKWFEGILYAVEFDVRTGDKPEPLPPSEKIRNLIRSSDAFVAVLTRRDKIEGRNSWRPPEWVQNEIGMAYEAGKPIAIFSEADVEIAGVVPQISQYERFDRGNLAEAAPRIVRYLVTLRNQVSSYRQGLESGPLARALMMELLNRMVELENVEHSLEFSPWNLSFVYSKVSGQFYTLPDDVQSKVEDAQAAISEMSAAVSQARKELGLDKITFSLKSGFKSGPEPVTQETRAAVEARIAALKPGIIERVRVAGLALIQFSMPEVWTTIQNAMTKTGN